MGNETTKPSALRLARLSAGLTLTQAEELLRSLGVSSWSKSSIARWENGDVKPPRKVLRVLRAAYKARS